MWDMYGERNTFYGEKYYPENRGVIMYGKNHTCNKV